jgi:flagellar hook assembly protein FlgD
MTEIRYDLPSATKVRLHVLDLNGRVVRTLISGLMQPGGRHSITWGGRDDRGQKVASGTYIYQLRTSDFVEMRRMVLLK